MKIKSLIQLLRIEQWSKNLFIFLPAFFSGNLLNVSTLFASILSFFAFSFAASSIYCFNDIFDLKADSLHPNKSKRPVASGAISIKMAYTVMITFIVFSMVLLFFFGEDATKYKLMGLIVFYYVMNLAYCIKLKRYVIVDVIIISIGFVLRIFVGGAATDIWLSEWLILMTFLLALFLAFAKRRDDVILFISTGELPRKNTKRYNLEFINQVISLISSIIIMAYIMYTLSPEVTTRFSSNNVYLTALFVIMGIIRYMHITIVHLKSGSPTKIFLHDRFIQACIVCWIISFLIIIYI